jgi:TRAP-type mannitol/chloroaromatic compound transport system permease small subunit
MFLTFLVINNFIDNGGQKMKSLLRTLDYIDKFHEYVAKTTAWLIIPVFIIMTYEVIMRKGFNNSLIWSHEMSYFLCSCMIMLGMAYVLKRKGHISIDVLYNRFPDRVKAAVDIFFFLLFFVPLWYFGIKIMSYYLVDSYVGQDKDYWGRWYPLLWPLKAWTLVGAVMLFIQGVVEFIRDAIWFVKGGARS